MVKIGKIDDELNVFQGKQVVIWGTGEYSMRIYRYLKYFNINVMMYCDNNSAKWGGGHHLNRPVISPEELLELYNRKNVIVVIGCHFDQEISKQLDDMGITDYVLYEEMVRRLKVIAIRRKADISVLRDIGNSEVRVKYEMCQYIFNNPDDSYLLRCQPGKTGNNTIRHALEAVGYDHGDFRHNPQLYKVFCDILGNKYSDSKIKIITSVREPVSHNLAHLFQTMSPGEVDSLSYLMNNIAYWGNGGDAQKMFDELMEQYLHSDFPIYDTNSNMYYLIQNFFAVMQNMEIGSCFAEKEFDKEAGFTIYKKNNIEIFAYQLEKLNEIWSEMCRWLDIEQIPLVSNNIADVKWYASPYRQAKKEIKISQEYFDKCYSEPYVKYFYSDKDIEKFKDKWRSHIASDI